VVFKIRRNPFSAEALPRTPLGELTTLPRPLSWLERGHPSPCPTPLGTDPPSALAMRPPPEVQPDLRLWLHSIFVEFRTTRPYVGLQGLGRLCVKHQSINQSLFISGNQSPCQPIHIKRKKAHTTLYNITTQTDEKREKLSRYWSETSAAEVHSYIFSI